MGVAGSGKSAVGAGLAQAIGAEFLDGDDLHPAANRARMAAGLPLRDSDRWPWLDTVGAWLAAGGGPRVIACSALTRAYRDRIRQAAPGTIFLHLSGPKALIAARMAARQGHFMPTSLLDSQFATLEPPGPDEAHATLDVSGPLDGVIAAARAALG